MVARSGGSDAPFSRTPDAGGSSPVRIDAWDGSVSGTALRAALNRAPRAATLSIVGVSAGLTRSARSVSIVISRTFGDATVTGAGARPQPASTVAARTRPRFTRQLSSQFAVGS